MFNVAVTGPTGFVGSQLIGHLLVQGNKVLSLGRRPYSGLVVHAHYQLKYPEILSFKVLEGVDVLIHSAARVHVMDDVDQDSQALYNKLNAEASVELAKKAIAAGVKRFIYLSSVKVVGERTLPNKPFSQSSPMLPEDDYGRSKALAEMQLAEVVSGSSMELVIIRPPLVYGPGVKANFALLMKLAERNYPLPLASINNKRSMVGLDNLIDLINVCITAPEAAGQTFFVSDGVDLSTSELLALMTKAYGKKSCLWPFPPSLLRLAATIIGKRKVADRIFESLQVDISFTRSQLGWTPKYTVEQQLSKCIGRHSND
jgi:UDP-glucose 4-epimerase